MIELYQLEQLYTVAQCGTLSGAAEQLHISQPALTRSMQKLENELQISLFERTKNKMTLNRNGELAVEYARRILDQSQEMVTQLRAFDRRQRTIHVGTCAPAPLWELLPALSSSFPDMTISSEIKEAPELLQGLQNDEYTMIVLQTPVEGDSLCCLHWGDEQLHFSLPADHPLADRESLSFQDLDGETMLIYSQIGFWHDVHARMMPNTRFLFQPERSVFMELLRASTLPAFCTNLSVKKDGLPENRTAVPIRDAEATVSFYCIYKKANRKLLNKLFR